MLLKEKFVEKNTGILSGTLFELLTRMMGISKVNISKTVSVGLRSQLSILLSTLQKSVNFKFKSCARIGLECNYLDFEPSWKNMYILFIAVLKSEKIYLYNFYLFYRKRISFGV